MRVCFVCDSYPTLPHYGGIDVYVRTAAQALAAQGHQVHVLVIRKDRKCGDMTDGDVRVHCRPVYWVPVLERWMQGLGMSICVAWWLYRLHKQYHFTITEFPNWEGVGFVACLLRITPTVVRLHTSMTESVTALKRSPTLGERYMIWAERMSARLADAVVTHSESHRDTRGAAYGIRQIHVIPHGIPIPKPAPPDRHPVRAVLRVGGFSARKGAETFLAAIPLVLNEVPDVEFWLAGYDPGHRFEAAFRAAHPDIPESKVRFWGFVSRDQLDKLYASCLIYASAAVYESFGFTYVEAMAHGKPVVACRVSAMTETIEHEKTGLLVPPEDPSAFAAAIVRLLRDPALCAALGSAGRRVAIERYSDTRMANDLEQFFQRVSAHAHSP